LLEKYSSKFFIIFLIFLDKHSGIPGSPRTAAEKRKHEKIEESKENAYNWENNSDEEHLIFLI
jgi:hypothetical protein